jgi:hypothetical protein
MIDQYKINLNQTKLKAGLFFNIYKKRETLLKKSIQGVKVPAEH